LKGDAFDGNKYAEAALTKGAVLAVVDDPSVATDDHYFLVEDVLTTLQDLARFHRSHFTCPVIGITGTNGKTTTKELINAVLGSHYRTHATKGNLNNHIGVPLTLLSARVSDVDMLIVEMGANHQGEIAFLCSIANPTHGLITNVGKAHLEGFGGVEGVIKGKTELYRYLKSINGKAFVCTRQPVLSQLSAELEPLTYGESKESSYSGTIVSSDPFLIVNWHEDELDHLIHTHLVGGYNIDNVMAAICVGSFFNVSSTKIIDAIESYIPSNNRSQVMQTGNNQLVLDAYNANPSSMAAALENFALMDAFPKVVILGDMFELGEESRDEHQQIVILLLKHNFKDVLLIGPKFFEVSEKTSFKRFLTIPEALQWIILNPFKGRSILVKGSRGMKMETLLPVL
jgi:UDP-N-acetylmuramoyl-tripeptide--D-alanyl-D-alanine ligase